MAQELAANISTYPTLAAIVVNWNRRSHLRTLLEDLQHQSQPANELVVVDNGSTDGSPEMVEREYQGVRLIRLDRNMGLCFGRNVGIHACRSELLMFPDNDLRILDTDFLRRARDSARSHPDCGLIGFQQVKVLTHNQHTGLKNPVFSWSQLETMARNGHLPIPKSTYYVATASGGSCLVRRSTFDKVGVFDPSLWYGGEETDLAFRCHRIGIRIVRDTGLWVVHIHAVAMRSRFREGEALKNEIMMSIRHMPMPDLIFALACRVVQCFGAPRNARYILHRLLAVWSGISSAFKDTAKAKRSPCCRSTMSRFYLLDVREPKRYGEIESCTMGPLRYWPLRLKKWFLKKSTVWVQFTEQRERGAFRQPSMCESARWRLRAAELSAKHSWHESIFHSDEP